MSTFVHRLAELRHRPRCMLGVVAAAHVPFLGQYFANLWNARPHYDFFPVLLAVVGLLWWQRRDLYAPPGSAERYLEGAALLLGFLLLAAAVLLGSPWLAAVAAVWTAGSLLLYAGGARFLRDGFPVWCLLWLLIAPPWGWDRALVHWMQEVTTHSSSAVLEVLGVPHLRAGNVIQFPDHELFVAEACSGVHGQLVMAAAAAVLAVLARRPALHALLLVLAGLGWATWSNVVRVSGVAAVYHAWGWDWSTGWPHEALGLMLMVVGLMLVMSTDQLLLLLLGPIRPRDTYCMGSTAPVAAEEQSALHPVSRIWNRCLARGQKEWPQRAAGAQPPERAPWRFSAWAYPFAVLALLQCVVLASDPGDRTDGRPLEAVLEQLKMPDSVDAWQRVAYEVARRDRSSDEGARSQIWRYRSGPETSVVSVDYPFWGWHELTRCYEARGWRVDSREVRDISGAEPSQGQLVIVQLSTPEGDHGLLLFSLLDTSGHPIPVRAAHWQGLSARLRRSPLLRMAGATVESGSAWGASVQVQQFQVAPRPFTAPQVDAARRRYLHVRRRLESTLRSARETMAG